MRIQDNIIIQNQGQFLRIEMPYWSVKDVDTKTNIIGRINDLLYDFEAVEKQERYVHLYDSSCITLDKDKMMKDCFFYQIDVKFINEKFALSCMYELAKAFVQVDELNELLSLSV